MKKRLLSIILALSMVLGVCPTLFLTAHAATQTFSGTGTESDPYKIATAEDLINYADLVYAERKKTSGWKYKGYYVELTNNIVLTDTQADSIRTIGTYPSTANDQTECLKAWWGYFDGKNHTIRGLKHPLFGTVVGGQLKNGNATLLNKESRISNLYINGNIGDSKDYSVATGAFAEWVRCGYNGSGFLMENCTFTGTVTSSRGEVGGLVGLVEGQGDVTYEKGTYGVMTNCSVQNAVISSSGYKGYVGGLVGWAALSMSRCFAEGVTVQHTGKTVGVVGGLVGRIWESFMMDNCYFAGSVSNNDGETAYGLAYEFAGSKSPYGTTITNCYSYAPDCQPCSSQVLTKLTSKRNIYYYSGTKDIATDSNGITGLSESSFKKKSKFTGFDFNTVWTMSEAAGRPILEEVYPVPQIPNNIPVTMEMDKDETIDLAQYIVDKVGNDLTGQFSSYEITDGAAYAELDADTLKLTLKGTEAGEHSVKVTGTYKYKDDPENEEALLNPSGDNDIEFKITLTVTKTIPEPSAETTGFPYNPEITLDQIGLNDDWQWADGSSVPKTSGNYKVVYPIEDGKENYYYYNGEAAGSYSAENGGVVDYIYLTVTESDATPYKLTITVKNGDNNKEIEGAEVYSAFEYEFPDGHETDKNGQVVAQVAAGDHTFRTYMDGFDLGISTVKTYKRDDNELIVKLVPERKDVKLPTLYDDGIAVRTTATVVKLDNDTNPADAWNNGETTASYAGGSTQQLPTGKYRVDISARGYKSESVYMVVSDDGTVKYYTDEDCTEEITDLSEKLKVDKLEDPVYTATIDRSDNSTVKVTLKLKNVAAASGTFGMRYDTDLFSFTPADDFELNADNDIKLVCTPETQYSFVKERYGDNDIPKWDASRGYYVFRWSVGDETDVDSANKVLDTEQTEATIATFTFHLKSGAEWDDVTSDSFGIMPWTETDEAIAYKKWYDKKYANNPDAAGDYEFETYWRETDDENNAPSLGVGRIEESKAVVNNIDTGGFFEVAVNSDLGSDDLVYFYDVITVLDYTFDVKKTLLRFTVKDSVSDDYINNATVVLHPADGMTERTSKTNDYGVAKFVFDDLTAAEADYTYTVSRNGYWPVEATPVTVESGVVKNIEVKLVKKIYHVPEITAVGDKPINEVEHLELGGERYGYDGVDFYFRA